MVKFGLDLTIWPWEYRFFDEITEIAVRAERFGIDSVWMSDHLMYTNLDKGSLEVFTSLAAVATRTKDIRVGTKVVCTPFRHPGLIAKTGATLDIISGGRFDLGFGAGWYKKEFEAFGFPFERKVSRLREAVEIVKLLWEKSPVDYEGDFYKLRKAVSLPKPLQVPHPPIWIASSGPRMLRIAAELGDGWIIANPSVEDFRGKWNLIKGYAEKVERSSVEIEAGYYAYASLASTSGKAWESAEEFILPERRRVLGPELSLEDLGEICIVGGPDEWIKRIEQYVEAGAEHVIVKIVPLDFESLRLYSEDVVPHFK